MENVLNAIQVTNAVKVYKYIQKEPGLRGSIKSLLKANRQERYAVKNISFQVEEGEFVGLIGPNGAGKTTLIKLMTGIIHPSSGEINVLGYTPAKLKDGFKKQYSLVTGQKSQLWWDLPAIDSFFLNKAIYEIPDHEFHEKLDHFIDLFGISNLLNVQVRQLSLGERMKMELVSCLLHSPRIIFLDEPTIGLDVIAQKNIRQLLKETNEKLKVTIVLTSHYMEDIKHLCKRVIIINEGQKMYDGNLDDILNKHKESKIVSVQFNQVTVVALGDDVELIEHSPYKVAIKVQQDKVCGLIQSLVSKYDIADINIEEESISNLIEKIYNTDLNRMASEAQTENYV
jgi:ABC-2 type transport system ATP-binding protein